MPIHVDSSVKPRVVLKILNTKPLEESLIAAFDRDSLSYDPQNHLAYKPDHLDLCFFDTDKYVAGKLQQYVDEWLDMGIALGGREAPRKRSLLRAPLATAVLLEFAKECRPSLLFCPEYHEFAFRIDHTETPRLRNGFGGYIKNQNPVESARKKAGALFLGLMMSGWVQFLCKCRDSSCGRYFRKDKYKVQVYEYGLFCNVTHQRRFAAIVCTTLRRTLVQSKLVAYAAGQLLKTGVKSVDWQNDKARKIKLAQQVRSHLERTNNRERLTVQTVQLHWITRNRNAIESDRLKLEAGLKGQPEETGRFKG